MYDKVVQAGSPEGLYPNWRSIVTVHYTNRTINRKKLFDISLGSMTPTFRLSYLIKGWSITLQQMVGDDKWKQYIPTELGYGYFLQHSIPGGSTLILEIELLGIT